MKFIPLLLLIVLSSCTGNSYLENYHKAKKCFSAKKYAQSLNLLNTGISDNPEFIDGYLLRAKVKLHLADTSGALNDYKWVANRLDTENTYAFYELARMNRLLQYNRRALKYIELAIATKGSDVVWVENNRGLLRGPVYNVDMHKLLFQRGKIRYQMNDFENALRDFDRCTSSTYRMKESNYFSGNCLIELGYPDAAYEAYQEASDWGSLKADSVLKLFHE
ncbi:Tetratricopeptide repeat protein [compost metagenome]